jgi:hypothetical protein
MRVALLVLLMVGAPGAKLPFSEFAHSAQVTGVSAPGSYRVDVEETLWRHSRSARSLADVQVAGPGDEALPLEVRPVTSPVPPQPRAAHVETIPAVDGSTTITLDLGASPPQHDEVRLVASGGDFVRPVRVETSDDGLSFAVMATGGVVYRLGDAPAPNAQLAVRYPPSRARLVRITVAAGATPARFVDARPAARARTTLETRNLVLRTSRSQSDPTTRTTRVWLDDPAPREQSALPADAVTFDAPTVGFTRRATVSAWVDGVWRPIGSGVLHRPAVTETLGGTQESLRIAIQPVRSRRFVVRIDDEGERPLRIQRAFAERRARELVFVAHKAGPHMLYVGAATASTPARAIALAGRVHEAQLGPVEPNPRFGKVASLSPSPRQHTLRTWILAILIAAGVIALAIWIVRSPLRGEPTGTPKEGSPAMPQWA